MKRIKVRVVSDEIHICAFPVLFNIIVSEARILLTRAASSAAVETAHAFSASAVGGGAGEPALILALCSLY
jgi:hypothetical protein